MSGRCPGYGAAIPCGRLMSPGETLCRWCQRRSTDAAWAEADAAMVAEVRALLPAGTLVRLSLPSTLNAGAEVAIPAAQLLAVLRAARDTR